MVAININVEVKSKVDYGGWQVYYHYSPLT